MFLRLSYNKLLLSLARICCRGGGCQKRKSVQAPLISIWELGVELNRAFYDHEALLYVCSGCCHLVELGILSSLLLSPLLSLEPSTWDPLLPCICWCTGGGIRDSREGNQALKLGEVASSMEGKIDLRAVL